MKEANVDNEELLAELLKAAKPKDFELTNEDRIWLSSTFGDECLSGEDAQLKS